MNSTHFPALLEPSWKLVLGEDLGLDYMLRLEAFLAAEKAAGKVIYPAERDIFRALNLTPPQQVRVVIIGQDPYHGPGQADGLCFSVRPGSDLPPSLCNICKEISNELGVAVNTTGCLDHWAEQGVLLLNSILTVEQARPGSHQGKGWERFTNRIIELLNESRDSLVFMLWGSYAHHKGAAVDTARHLVLKSPHPSPLAAYRGFFGNGHFRKANDYLEARGLGAIDWTQTCDGTTNPRT